MSIFNVVVNFEPIIQPHLASTSSKRRPRRYRLRCNRHEAWLTVQKHGGVKPLMKTGRLRSRWSRHPHGSSSWKTCEEHVVREEGLTQTSVAVEEHKKQLEQDLLCKTNEYNELKKKNSKLRKETKELKIKNAEAQTERLKAEDTLACSLSKITELELEKQSAEERAQKIALVLGEVESEVGMLRVERSELENFPSSIGG